MALASMSLTGADMRVNGKMIGNMAKAKRNGGMVAVTTAGIQMGLSMAKESIGGLMEAGMSGITLMTKSMAKVSQSTRMAVSILESGAMEKSITKDSKSKMASGKKAAGKMAKE